MCVDQGPGFYNKAARPHLGLLSSAVSCVTFGNFTLLHLSFLIYKTAARPQEPLESKGPLVSPVFRLNSSVIARVNTQLVPIPFNRHTVQTQSVQESPNHTWVCTQNDENTRV